MATQPRKLSDAQRKRVQALVEARDRATHALNDFMQYLTEEHGIEQPEQWALNPQTWTWVQVNPPAELEQGEE